MKHKFCLTDVKQCLLNVRVLYFFWRIKCENFINLFMQFDVYHNMFI